MMKEIQAIKSLLESKEWFIVLSMT
jgi:hypothetical protein